MLIFIFNHCVKSFFSADYAHTFLCSCNSRIQKIPCHKHRSSRNQRHYNCRIFATLRFMNCNSVSQFQLFCLFRIICNISVIIKLYFYIISKIIYFVIIPISPLKMPEPESTRKPLSVLCSHSS